MSEMEFFEKFDCLVEKALKDYNVPAVAVGVIKDGEVLYSKGFGKKNLTDGQRPDGDTIFQIGSCSKAFTSTLVSILCDQGLLDLDVPVRNYLPELVFSDPFLTKNCTLRDLLSHRTGLPGNDMAWYASDFSREQLIYNMRYFPIVKPLRSHYHYNNLGYVLSGCICEKVTGKCWEDLIQQYILEPLELDRTKVYIEDIENSGNYAHPCNYPSGKDRFKDMEEIPFHNMPKESKKDHRGVAYGPAGSIGSCTNDMLKWVNFHLNNGKYKDKQIVSEKMMNQMHKPQMITPERKSIFTENIEFFNYGLAWNVQLYRGYKFISHTGSVNGFCAITTMMPDLNLGIVVYTNVSTTVLPTTLSRILLEHYLGYERFDLVDLALAEYKKASELTKNIASMLVGEKKTDTAPLLPLEKYLGVYHLDGYQDITISLKENQLYYQMGILESVLEHYHYETFVTTTETPILPAGLPFVFDYDGQTGTIKGVKVGLEFDDEDPFRAFQKRS